jgi:hypothetical protein
MKRSVALVTGLVLLFGSVAPSHAAGGGWRGGAMQGSGWHGGGMQGSGWHGGGWHGGWHGGGWHGGWHGGCCWGGWWWPAAVVGGLALGAAVAATYPYYYPYPYYYAPPAVTYAPPAVAYPQAAYPAPPAPPLQREVVYPNGKHVLLGDGVTQAWQWVWIPSTGASPATGAPPMAGQGVPPPAPRPGVQAPRYQPQGNPEAPRS